MELDNISNKKLISALKASAALDIELCEDEYLRCFSYKANWEPGIDVASYENGGGDEIIIVIKGDSILIKGFDHESEISPHAQEEYGIWPGMYGGAPEELLAVLDNEALEIDHVTFCFWRTANTGSWQQGPVDFQNNEDNGTGWLLPAITTTPEDFIEYAKSYYEDGYGKITPERVRQVFKEYE
ncbi:hypothetical protein [Motilimonas eburnea]|uniref:hypothetical protein n=1 Tax=Motilimonas eburnea TaxID=1737488 RepID=UPI001E4438AF|nr:hypothetical protein [Motilimonas eburnea]MCE2573905.1 hypothetical protein [Motilimonas eburnea]